MPKQRIPTLFKQPAILVQHHLSRKKIHLHPYCQIRGNQSPSFINGGEGSNYVSYDLKYSQPIRFPYCLIINAYGQNQAIS